MLPLVWGFARIYPADAHHLEQVYRNFSLYAETMILQTARVMTVPWEEALHARFEWVGDVKDRADQPQVTDFGPTAERALESVIWHGYPIRVPPLEMQLQVSRRRGLTERALQIQQMLNEKHT